MAFMVGTFQGINRHAPQASSSSMEMPSEKVATQRVATQSIFNGDVSEARNRMRVSVVPYNPNVAVEERIAFLADAVSKLEKIRLYMQIWAVLWSAVLLAGILALFFLHPPKDLIIEAGSGIFGWSVLSFAKLYNLEKQEQEIKEKTGLNFLGQDEAVINDLKKEISRLKVGLILSNHPRF